MRGVTVFCLILFMVTRVYLFPQQLDQHSHFLESHAPPPHHRPPPPRKLPQSTTTMSTVSIAMASSGRSTVSTVTDTIDPSITTEEDFTKDFNLQPLFDIKPNACAEGQLRDPNGNCRIVE